MTPTETLEKWIEEAKLRIKSYKDLNAKEDQERTGIYLHALAVFTEPENRILTLAKALQSALEVLKEKDKMLLEAVGAFEKNYALVVEARDLKPHLEELERLG